MPAAKRRSFGKIRQHRSGRWEASYVVDGERIFHDQPFLTRGDAEGWLALRQSEILNGWRPKPADAAQVKTLGEYAGLWFANRTLKAKTRRTYEGLWTRYVSQLAELPLNGFTRPVVKAWYDNLARITTKNQQGDAYSLLRVMLNTAVEDQEITSHECHIKGGDRVKRQRKPIVLSVEEIEDLIANMPPRYDAMIRLAVWCSLRLGELTGLTRDDVDLKRSVVHVRRAVEYVDGKFIVDDPKSEAGKRSIHIPEPLVPALRAHIMEHAGPGRHGLVFPSPTDPTAYLNPDTLYWHWHKARAVIGRPTLVFHDTRHTGATRAGHTGATVKELMHRLGHSTPTAAMIYQQADAERDRQLAERLAAMMGSPATSNVVSLDERRDQPA